ncbi:MAG: efflux RND transporter periplasmic adaptor subunit [Bacteroidales bacterium]
MKHSILYVLIMIITITACNKKESITEEQNHDHGEIKLQFTVYTDQFELFAETDPFVKGQPANILAHFTNLKDFTPLSDAEITVHLKTGENVVSQTINNNLKPGIFGFNLTPEAHGAAQLVFDINTKGMNQQISVNNIVIYNDEHTAVHIAEKKHKEHLNAIAFTKEQSWKINFKTQYPDFKSFGKIIKTSAQVYSNPDSERLITAKTNGTIHLLKEIFDGSEVKKGESILSISPNGLAENNVNVRYIEVKNNYELAKSDFERKEALAQKQIISEKELENAKREFENAKAVFDNLKKNFSSDGQIVSSDFSGFIKNIDVKNGQYVEAGEQLFSVIGNNNLVIKAEVQQKYYAHLGNVESAIFKSIINNKSLTLEELNGRVLSVGKSIDNETGYLVPINFQIDNNDSFLPGSYIDAYIKIKSDKQSLLIPNTAIIEEQGIYYVMVQINPELFEKREVQLGQTDGVDSEVLSGINQNERIVAEGAIIVKLAAVTNSLDPHAGHVH